jgi:ligand-binding sensor domain-containing protein/two-component sensor histidine kinase
LLKKLLLLFLFFSTIKPFAQQRIGNFIAYGKETGLTQSAYHDVFESSDGYWWIGSNNGLFRFDGKRFKQIMYSYKDANSPADNNIIDLEEDAKGNLWIAGFVNGITKYNLKTGRFKQYTSFASDSANKNPVRCITKDSEGQLWFGLLGKFVKYIPEKDSFQLFYPNVPGTNKLVDFDKNLVTGIAEDNNNKSLLWIATYNGLYQFNKKTKSFTYISRHDNGLDKWLNQFLCLEQAGDELFMGTWYAGMIVYNKKNGQFRRVSYNNSGRGLYHYLVLDLQVVDSNGLYIAGSNDGLLYYHCNTGIITKVINPGDVAHIDNAINIQNVSLTKHAGFFAGGNSAIYQLSTTPNKFGRLVSTTELYKVVTGGPSPELTNVVFDNKRNGYWCSFHNHNRVAFYNRASFVPTYYQAVENTVWIVDMAVDANGKVWSLASNRRLCMLDDATGKMKYAEASISNGSLLDNASLEEIEPDGKGNYWLAGKRNVFFYDAKTNRLTPFLLPLEEIKKNSRVGIVFFSICADSKGSAWMSTSAGLLHFDRAANKTNYYYKSFGTEQSLAAGAIKSIAVDRDDNIWLGYFNEGIQVLDTKSKSLLYSFGMDDGLSSLEINYMACDDDNNMFVCLHSGLAVYNRRLKTWQVLNSLDGLQRDYLDVPIFATPGNNILLRQTNSFVAFNADSLWLNNDSSFTHISSLLINGKPYGDSILPDYINKVVLPSSTKDIHIEFSATNWRFPFRTKYFYRIDGVHKQGEWIEVKEASANLLAPASGNYTFRFYAITNNGVKTPEKSLQIVIKPPYYKTWWFITFILLTITAILYGLYKYRINQVNKMHAIRNNISRDLHDDIGASLSNINILNELAKRNAGDPVKSKEYLDKSGEDIQRISESISDIVWNINPRYDDVNNLLIKMKRYAADMMDGKNISYQIDIPDTAEKILLPMEKRRDMFLLFKEAVNNLVKYSDAKNALVKVVLDGKIISLLVKDDGKGFDRERIISGNGLHNMEQRAAAMGADFEIASAPGKGTELRLAMKTS